MQMVEKTELTEQLLMKGYLTRRYQGGEPMITSNLRTTLWSVEKQRRKKKKPEQMKASHITNRDETWRMVRSVLAAEAEGRMLPPGQDMAFSWRWLLVNHVCQSSWQEILSSYRHWLLPIHFHSKKHTLMSTTFVFSTTCLPRQAL